MVDVFISYERGSKGAARRAAALLRAAGHDVWLDADLPPNRAYADVIRERLDEAKAVLVLWTAAAAASEWVRAEADVARQRHKLVQASLDGADLPLPFNQIHCVPLPGLDGPRAPTTWPRIAAAIDELVARPAAPPARPPSRRPPRINRLALGLAAILIAAVAVAGGLWLARGGLPGSAASAPRLAILPFRVESAAADARFIADGLTEQIQSALSNQRFQVVSRGDAEALSGPDAASRVNQLGVRLLFDGAVQDDGKTISATVNLNDPRNHVAVWSARLDGPADQPDALKAHVAALIVTVLNCAGRALDPSDGLSDPQVLTQYLVSCDRLARNGEDNPGATDEMVSALRQVISRAPSFPPAHSALAKYLAYDAAVAPADQAAAFRAEARTEANRALALDRKDADAFVALALLEPAQNWAGREALLRRAVAANPDWPHANGFLGEVLGETGRIQEAAGYLQTAAAEDQPGQNWQGEAATVLVAAGRTSEADAAYAEMLKLWPDSPDDWFLRLAIREQEGRWDDALAVLNEPVAAQVLSPADRARTRAWLAAAKTHSPQALAQGKANLMAAASESPAALTVVISDLAAMGDVDDAFKLVQGYQPGLSRTGATTAFLFLPATANLRRDPRFLNLAARIGLLQYWRATGHWPDFCRDPDLPYKCPD